MHDSEAIAAPNLSALRRHFEISLYLLLLTSVLALVSTGKLDLVSILLPPVALLVKGYRWWRGRGPELPHRIATWMTAAYIVFFPFDLWIVSRILSADAQSPGLYAALLATIHLMLFAMIVRLYTASTIRDYLFLALMAFASMLASAILTVDSLFLGFFALFLALAASTFTGLEMWRSAQGSMANPIEIGTPAAHRLHRALGRSSAAVALGAVAVGFLLFLFLPRFNAGYLSRFNLQPTLISGFSEDVELGQIGEIKKSSAVVMRIQVEGGLDAGRGTHWRGIALTQFDGRRWFNENLESTTLMAAPEGWVHLNNGELTRRRGGVRMHYTVLLEPIASSAIFLANEAESVRGRFSGESGSTAMGRRRVYLLRDSTGSVFNPYHSYSRMQYDALSVLPKPPPAALREAGTDYSAIDLDTYLQLPELDPRIPELAAAVTKDAVTPYDKAVALENYLRTRYGYTLDLSGPAPSDPLAYFLFQKRAGHCEYFAAAMTVMMRSAGIPARYVNGFLTGEYNDIGDDFVVRASDAHSWVEVFFPGYGWLTFDPTPPSDDGPPGFFARLGYYWDWAELQWSEWVINYDFLHQFTLVRGIGRASRERSRDFRTMFADARRAATDRLNRWQSNISHHPAVPAALALLGALAILALVLQPRVRRALAAFWRLRVAPPSSMTPQLATLQYGEMLRLLARRGMRKAPGQTPLEFAGSLPDTQLAAPVHELTSLYHAARFGTIQADPHRATSILARIQTLLHRR